MTDLFRSIPLENGLTISLYDHTRRYYGDFYLVKLEIACNVEIVAGFFTDDGDFSDAKRLLGTSVVYRRFVEQMGVPSTAIEQVQQKLVQHFIEHSLPYFSNEGFAQKLVFSELKKARKRLGLQTVR